MSDNPDMPFSLYLWEAKALLDGARLRDIDSRRFMLEQAVDIANFQNAKKPKQVVKKAYKSFTDQENKITRNIRDSHTMTTEKLQILKNIQQAFGGDG